MVPLFQQREKTKVQNLGKWPILFHVEQKYIIPCIIKLWYDSDAEFLMLESVYVQQVIEEQLFGQQELFKGMSRPVLRRDEQGELCLAVFLTLFSLHSVETGMFERPRYFILADINNAAVKEFIDTKYDHDFSNASGERDYDLRSREDPVTRNFYDETYAILDEVRKKYLETGVFDGRRYRVYLKRITEHCPIAYRRFFRELSV